MAGTIGFIGVGEIATAIVEGLAGAEAPPESLVLSPRGRDNVASLVQRFPGLVTVAEDNQAVADSADTIIVAVLPEQLTEALEPVAFRASHVIISALACVTIAEVRAAVGVDVPVIRAIPMPPVRNRAVATVVIPEHPAAAGIFDKLGGTLPVTDETALSVFSSATGAVSGFIQYLAVVCSWVESQGVPQADAETFLRGLFAGLSPAIKDMDRSIDEVVGDHETSGGLNEQLRQRFFDEDGTASLQSALEELRARVTGS